jgi:ParB-like chromosome segregation protein Spo0J
MTDLINSSNDAAHQEFGAGMKLSRPLIDDITVPERHRDLDPEKVAELAASMRQIGQLSAIIVFRAEDSIILVAGRHRLEAARQLGWDRIDASYVEGDELQRELIEIDENLCRSELRPADQAIAIGRRKAIYEAMHPETKPTSEGGAGRNKETRRQNGEESADRFTKDTADKTGMSERTAQRNTERARVIGEENLRKIAGTSLDKPGELDALVKLDPATRDDLCNRAESGAQVSAKATLNPIPEAQPQPNPVDDDRWRELDRDPAAAEEEAEAGSQPEQESEADPEVGPNAQDESDDDYVPWRTVTKAELMAALKTILACRSEGDLAHITDPDVELHDALKEAREIIWNLGCQVENDGSVKEALEEKQRAEEEKQRAEKAKRKAQYKIAKKQAPAIRERAAKLGYELVKLCGTTFYFGDLKTRYMWPVEFDGIDRWLEERAAEGKAAATGIEAAA